MEKKIKHSDIGDTVMEIHGFWGPYDAYKSEKWDLPDLKTDEIYRLTKEAGFNVISQSNDDYPGKADNVKKALDFCQKYNMFYLVASSKLKRFKAYHTKDNELFMASEEEICQTLGEVLSHPACFGMEIQDEPLPVAVPEVGEFVRRYKNALKTLGLTDRSYYLNLLPVSGFVSNPPTIEGWQEYVQSAIDHCGRDFVDYDFYPFQKSESGSKDNISPGLYSHLEALYEVVDKNGGDIPMGIAPPVGGNWTEEEDNPANRAPSPEELEWEIGVSLAFGVTRFEYFTLCNPHSFLKYMPHGQTGVFNPDGSKGKLYDAVKRSNEQIIAVDEYLLKSKNKQVMFLKDYPSEIDYRYKDHINDKNSSYKELVSVDGDGAIIGCFDYKGKTALYVVNTFKKAQTLTLNFDIERKVKLVNRMDGVVDKTEKTVSLNLGKAEATLVIVE